MKYSNLISTRIPQQDINEILTAIDFINGKLENLKTLTEEEKSALPKMRERTIDFVYKCLKIAEQNPEVVPRDVDVPEIIKDFELVQAIEQINEPLKLLMKKLEDSALLAASEAYLPSVAIHNAHKHAEVKKRSKNRFLQVS